MHFSGCQNIVISPFEYSLIVSLSFLISMNSDFVTLFDISVDVKISVKIMIIYFYRKKWYKSFRMTKNVMNIRKEFLLTTLDEDSVIPDPVGQFEQWFNEALSAGINEPNAMVLSTTTKI